jgi:hypothetical protein
MGLLAPAGHHAITPILHYSITPFLKGRAPACAAESPKLSPLGAAPRRLAITELRFAIYDLRAACDFAVPV